MTKPTTSLTRTVRHRPRLIVSFSDVVWVEGAAQYSLVHFQDGTALKVAIPIAAMASRLPELIRIHRGQLVNLLHVRKLERLPNTLHLSTGECLPIARRRWALVQRHYLTYRSTLRFPNFLN